jgi:type III pantothenate kinase
MDVGNSHTVVGLYEKSVLRGHWRIVTGNYRTSDELRVMIAMLLQQEGVLLTEISGACISSVVPQLNMALQQMCREGFRVEPITVEPGIKTGLKLQTENPKEVGADRIANAVAAIEEYEGPLIIIDFGTATTFDYISEDGEYKGGIIVPGIQVSADALFERCAKLPRVEIAVPDHVIGRNTVNSIRSGLTYGYADMVAGLVRRMSEQMDSRPKVIATGGLAQIMASVTDCFDVVDPLLALKGLAAIYRKNEKVPA